MTKSAGHNEELSGLIRENGARCAFAKLDFVQAAQRRRCARRCSKVHTRRQTYLPLAPKAHSSYFKQRIRVTAKPINELNFEICAVNLNLNYIWPLCPINCFMETDSIYERHRKMAFLSNNKFQLRYKFPWRFCGRFKIELNIFFWQL